MQRSGVRGLFALEWAQIEIDGLRDTDPSRLHGGMILCWQGRALRLDGPQALLSLTDRRASAQRARQRARTLVARMLSTIDEAHARAAFDCDADEVFDQGRLLLTDGVTRYAAFLVETRDPRAPLLVFCDALPPPYADLFVLEASDLRPSQPAAPSDTMICFTPGTHIRNGQGWCAVTDLRPGDRILTRDDGLQEITWIGNSHVSAAQLAAQPDLRPVRLRAGAVDGARPDAELVVSPDHRILLQGAMARALFGEAEVLVAARDLLNDASIHRDYTARSTHYIHVLLPRHAVIWANDLPCESFHPADMALDRLPEPQRKGLLQVRPDLARPMQYGPAARRCLDRAEAALLRGAMHLPI